jgi:hypothetical protein
MSLSDALAVAGAQHGLITLEQAAEAGLALHKVRHLVDSGHWERRGGRRAALFAVVGSPRTYEQDVMAACLATEGLGVASHGCAARLLGLGLPAFTDAPVTVTIPRGGPRGRAQALGATVHATRNLPAGRLDLVEPHATAYCGVVRAASARAGITTTVREAAAR